MSKINNLIVKKIENSMFELERMKELMYFFEDKVNKKDWINAYCSIDDIDCVLVSALREYAKDEEIQIVKFG